MNKVNDKFLKFENSWKAHLIKFLLPCMLMVFFIVVRNIAFSVIFGVMTFFNITSLKTALLLYMVDKAKKEK